MKKAYTAALGAFASTPIVLSPVAAWAAGASSAPPATAVAAGSLLQLILGLAAVLVLIFGGAWFLKRYGRVSGLIGSGAVRVLGAVSLGARERAVLLQVGARQLLVGVAPGRVQTLYVLDEPIATTATGGGGEGGAHGAGLPSGAAFAQRLAALMRNGRVP
jgi:flagellar protein FliO/FliZ